MNVRDRIYSAFQQGKTVVFPSETSARSFVYSYVRDNPGKVLRTDCAMSSDRFEESLKDIPADRKKANTTDRLLFAEELVKSNKNFSYFGKASAKEIFKALPKFEKLGHDEYLPSSLKKDINIILEAYKAFMDRKSLYEDGFISAEKPVPEDVVLAFESAYKQDIQKTASTVLIETDDSSLPEIKVYENTLTEVRSCFRKTVALLEGGTKIRDIAITVTDINSIKGLLYREASKRGIKLAFMQGKMLSDYPSGRLFSHIARIKGEQYSLKSLKDFLLDPAYPFKNSKTARDVIEFAIENHAIDCGIDAYILKAKLKAVGEKAGTVFEFVSSLTDCINRICNAKDCLALRNAINNFKATFFADDAWTTENTDEISRVFQRCMSVIDEIDESIKDSGFYPDNIFELFCRALSVTSYISQDVAGLKVYQYPLSCGLSVKHHFVLGLDDSASRVKKDENPFAGRLENNSVQIGDAVIRSYCFDTNGLTLSCARQTYSGNSMAPALFTERKLDVEVTSVEDDSFSDELLLWQGNKTCTKALKTQTCSFDKAIRTVFVKKEVKTNPVEKPYKMSASRLNEFALCPFRYMCHYILDLDEIDFDALFTDNKKIGNILHNTYETWLTVINDLNNAASDSSLNLLTKILAGNLEKYRKSYEAVPDFCIRYIGNKYSSLLTKITEPNNFKFLADTKLFKTEQHFVLTYPEYEISGYIDAIFETSDGSYVVIDFKKGKVPADKTQIALYAKALETESKIKPIRGAFYSIEESKFSKTFDNEVTLENLKDNLQQLIENNLDCLNKNIFPSTPGDDQCLNCDYSRICRKRYVVK